MSEQEKQTYPGGFRAIVSQMEKRQDPLVYLDGEALPPLDADLQQIKTRTVQKGAAELGRSRSTYARKYRELAKQFHGQSGLLHLHGLLIANLRRKGQPEHTAALFNRLWAEEPEFLLDHLDARWLVSAVTTFGDHGQTADQRQLGQALSVLFGMMKLYETERLYSGHAPADAFPIADRSARQLALQMDPFALSTGGLDVNLLGGLWQQAEQVPVLRPLAQRLLSLLISDDMTVFRRLRTMRAERDKALKAKGIRQKSSPKRERIADVPPHILKTDPATLRWGVVAMIKAPLVDTARFAAHHLDLGAHRLHIFLDDPAPRTVEFLSCHPNITVTTCDNAYWDTQKKPRMKAHQMRQVWVATQAYQDTDVDWLAHLDVDEFLLPPAPVADLLAQIPGDMAVLRMAPAELLAGSQGNELFKLQRKFAGQGKAALEAIYPNFGSHLPDGFVSHREGKNFARTGLDGIRLGIHTVLQDGALISNRTRTDGFFIGHAHAPSWGFFRDHMKFRMTRGSYRKSDEEKFRLLDILEFLHKEDGEDGLRLFFHEVCEATPHLVSALEKHRMLLRYRLDLDTKVQRQFGMLPEQEAAE
ncbi:glycosyltransferase family 2 protein [Thalassovita sp.]|uniref:glycosyltransferase family 2 protein n=1 Tax=Thalassovita sp. TaxID=1979401 RepID=UPI0029DE5785|nr:glycosyltransferase family 2 protein [Thalassovita sp.]